MSPSADVQSGSPEPDASAGRRARAPRPWTVRLLVGLVALVAVLEAAVGVVAAIAAREAVENRNALIAVAVLEWIVAAALVWIAVALWRGSDTARLALTLVTAAIVLSELAQVFTGEPHWGSAVGTAAVYGGVLVLAWAPTTRHFYQGERERLLAAAVAALSPATAQRRARRVVEALAQALAVALTIWLTPGVTAGQWWSLLMAAVMVGLASMVLQPVLVQVTSRFGWWGALFTAVFAQAMVLGLGLMLTPGIHIANPWWLLVGSWIYGIIATALNWLIAVSAQDYLILHSTRMALRNPAPASDTMPGVLFLQLDGVPAPVLEYELRSGNLPTISGWLRDGSHTWGEWVARVPSTTPVSQAGILHGNNDEIPAFRWYDRELGRMLVANRPADATVIESRVSDGNGLLADDGVSISNLFSGDAPTSLLTMSGLRGAGRGLGPSSSYAAFFTHPAGLARAVTLTIGEMVKEVFQARRQARQGVKPRVHRGGAYVALRGITNVFLRDLNVALVVEAMMQGRKSVYVDFVDYDEIAHHAGVTRPESLASLYGLDQVVNSLDVLARSGVTPRPYEIVLVSDHGQSQGATFLQRYGLTLESLVASLTGGRALDSAEDEQEARGRVRALVVELAGQDSVSGRIARRAMRADAEVIADAAPREPSPSTAPALAVIGSGNLGAVWFTDSPARLTLAQLDAAHPGLVEALAAHPGVGFVVVASDAGPVAIGADGAHALETGDVTGVDPLTLFGEHARADLLRAASFANAPDIYLNSAYDPVLDEVSAFEELVGCHGGLGGWQTRPMVVHPTGWTVDADLADAHGRLYGADSVHRQFVRWLEALGHRGGIAPQE